MAVVNTILIIVAFGAVFEKLRAMRHTQLRLVEEIGEIRSRLESAGTGT